MKAVLTENVCKCREWFDSNHSISSPPVRAAHCSTAPTAPTPIASLALQSQIQAPWRSIHSPAPKHTNTVQTMLFVFISLLPSPVWDPLIPTN